MNLKVAKVSLEVGQVRKEFLWRSGTYGILFFFKTRENSKFDIKFLTNPNPLAPSTMAKYENFS